MRFPHGLGVSLGWIGHHEGAVLLTASAAVVLALFGFAKIAGKMLEGETKDFDVWFLRILRHADHPEIPVVHYPALHRNV